MIPPPLDPNQELNALRIQFTPRGWVFFCCDALEQLFGGAKQGSKTVTLCQKAIALSTSYPGNRGMLMRNKFPDLRESLLETFLRVCPSDLILGHNKQEHKLLIKTSGAPSTVLYFSSGDIQGKKAAEKRKGFILGWLGIDEATEVPPDVYFMMLAQLTWRLPNGERPPYMAMLTANPEPGWVKDRFLGVPSRGIAPAEGTLFIPALPKDNPFLEAGWVEQQRRVHAHDPEWISKYLDGNWDVSEGMVFEGFDRRLHCIPDFDIRGLKLLSGFDYASTGTTAYVDCGMDSSGNLFVLQEHYEENRLVHEHAAAIHRMRHMLARRAQPDETLPAALYAASVADPSIFAKTQQLGGSEKTSKGGELQSIAYLYQQNGLNFTPAWNDIEAGIERLKEYLWVNPLHRHPFTGALGSPRLFIVEKKCPNLVRELMELRKEVLPAGGTRYVGSDHALDCLRYIVNSQPRPPRIAPPDLATLPSPDRKILTTHAKWVKNFGKQNVSNTWM